MPFDSCAWKLAARDAAVGALLRLFVGSFLVLLPLRQVVPIASAAGSVGAADAAAGEAGCPVLVLGLPCLCSALCHSIVEVLSIALCFFMLPCAHGCDALLARAIELQCFCAAELRAAQVGEVGKECNFGAMAALADLTPGLIVEYFDSHTKKWGVTKVLQVEENGVRLAGRTTILPSRDIEKRIVLKGGSAAGSEATPQGMKAPESNEQVATRKRGEPDTAWQQYARKWLHAFHNDLEKVFKKLSQDCPQDEMKERLARAFPKMDDSVYAQFQRLFADKEAVQGHVHPSTDLALVFCFERSNSMFYWAVFPLIFILVCFQSQIEWTPPDC